MKKKASGKKVLKKAVAKKKPAKKKMARKQTAKQPTKKTITDLLAAANAEVETVSAEQALAMRGEPDVVFVDIRDIRELEREGTIPEAYHAPRGMLEFWVAPDSPYYRDIFGSGKKFLFFCAGGGRSALAAQVTQQLGLEPVCHMAGGFAAWKAAGGPVAEVTRKPAP